MEKFTQGDAAQRVPELEDNAVPQRVPTKKEESVEDATEEEETKDSAVLMSGLEVTYQSLKDNKLQSSVTSQDWDGPSQNTRAARRQRLLAAVEGMNTAHQQVRKQRASSPYIS